MSSVSWFRLGSWTHVVVVGELTAGSSRQYLDAIAGAIVEDGLVEVDLSRVLRLPAPFAQAVLESRRAASLASCELVVVAASAEAASELAALGRLTEGVAARLRRRVRWHKVGHEARMRRARDHRGRRR